MQTDLIIMDFAGAFDKVPHRRLPYKLQSYGIQENPLFWACSYFWQVPE
jgi:hypothetical protein